MLRASCPLQQPRPFPQDGNKERKETDGCNSPINSSRSSVRSMTEHRLVYMALVLFASRQCGPQRLPFPDGQQRPPSKLRRIPSHGEDVAVDAASSPVTVHNSTPPARSTRTMQRRGTRGHPTKPSHGTTRRKNNKTKQNKGKPTEPRRARASFTVTHTHRHQTHRTPLSSSFTSFFFSNRRTRKSIRTATLAEGQLGACIRGDLSDSAVSTQHSRSAGVHGSSGTGKPAPLAAAKRWAACIVCCCPQGDTVSRPGLLAGGALRRVLPCRRVSEPEARPRRDRPSSRGTPVGCCGSSRPKAGVLKLSLVSSCALR